MDLDSSLQAFTLDHARICGVNKTFSRGSFRPLGETKLEIKMEKRFRVTHQFNYSVVHNLIGKVNKHVALRSQQFCKQLCILPVSFHRRLQGYI